MTTLETGKSMPNCPPETRDPTLDSMWARVSISPPNLPTVPLSTRMKCVWLRSREQLGGLKASGSPYETIAPLTDDREEGGWVEDFEERGRGEIYKMGKGM